MAPKFCKNCGNLLKEGSKFCTNCGAPVTAHAKAEAKVGRTTMDIPASVFRSRKPMSKRAKFMYSMLGTGIAVGFFLVFISDISDRPHPIIEKQQTVAMAAMYTDETFTQSPVATQVSDGKIIIPLSAVLERKIVEFEYNGPTTVVPLLAYISNEGKLVTAFRFCEPCNSKTFNVEGKELACGNCETRWKLNNLRGISGTCQKYPPAPIPSGIVGNEVRIEEKTVANWKSRL